MFVIDDLANREHSCDLLLDQNYFQNNTLRYRELVKGSCKLLLGPEYALLREEFSGQTIDASKKEINEIMVYFGGSDTGNNTLKALKGIHASLGSNSHVKVILNTHSSDRGAVESFAETMTDSICLDFVENMSEIMYNSDLYVGSAGITTWERCSMGLASIVVAIAENQVEPMNELYEAGMSFFLGRQEDVTPEIIAKQIDTIYKNPSDLEIMRKKSWPW